jgi:hypothetical protein
LVVEAEINRAGISKEEMVLIDSSSSEVGDDSLFNIEDSKTVTRFDHGTE